MVNGPANINSIKSALPQLKLLISPWKAQNSTARSKITMATLQMAMPTLIPLWVFSYFIQNDNANIKDKVIDPIRRKRKDSRNLR